MSFVDDTARRPAINDQSSGVQRDPHHMRFTTRTQCIASIDRQTGRQTALAWLCMRCIEQRMGTRVKIVQWS